MERSLIRDLKQLINQYPECKEVMGMYERGFVTLPEAVDRICQIAKIMKEGSEK